MLSLRITYMNMTKNSEIILTQMYEGVKINKKKLRQPKGRCK